MNPERLAQIRNAIKAASDAGDEDAVRVLFEGFEQEDSLNARKYRIERATGEALANGDTAAAQSLFEGYQKEFGSPAPNQPPAQPQAAQPQAAQPAPPELSPREQGRAAGRKWTPIGAAAQGVGSMLFGLGTPAAAVIRMAETALPGGEAPVGYTEAREFARGQQQGAKEAHPIAYGVGAVYGVTKAVPALVKGVAQIAPKAASVFTLRAGQTARNIARLGAGGAAAAGVTAGLQEGADAVAPAAAVGAVAAPVGAGVVGGAAALGRAVMSRISPDAAAIKLLATRLKEPADVIAKRYNALLEQFERAGITRKPSLIELTGRETAAEIGVIAGRSPGAGQIMTEAQEAAALRAQTELPAMIESAGQRTTLPEQQAQLAPITAKTKELVGSRVRSTETAQLARRDVVMDRVMNKIGNQRVRLSDDMLEVITDPDVQQALEPALRRRINKAIDQGETIGSLDLSVRTWEMMRQALANKSGPGTGQVFSRLRDKVRDYVSDRVPEYGTALKEFGRRSSTAEATTAARQAVSKDVREFADAIKGANVPTRAGARVGARNWLANELGGTPQQAERAMSRLARDNRLRQNLREVLSKKELEQLEELSGQYGRQLNIIEGVKVGSRVLPAGDAAKFEDAVRSASGTAEGAAGVRASARSALRGAAGESPGRAAGVAEALGEHRGLQLRVQAALGAPEAARLQKVGEATTRGLRNLETATPRTTEAAARAARQAEEIKTVIGAATVAGGHTGGAFKAAFASRIVQRLKIGERAAKRMAEMAVDTKDADKLIAQLRKSGVTKDDVLRLYRDAAIASGVIAGQ